MSKMEMIGHDWRLSNFNEKERIEHITSVAIITRGLTKIKDERKSGLYQDLLLEGYMGTANRIFEFLPVVISYESGKGGLLYLNLRDNKIVTDSYFSVLSNTNNQEYVEKCYNPMELLDLFRFSYVDTVNKKIYTNMRALLKFGIAYENIPYNQPEELIDFRLVETITPFFVWKQLYTHTVLSKVSESDRVSRNEVWNVKNIWLPEDIHVKVMNRTVVPDEDDKDKFKYDFPTLTDLKNYLINELSQTQLFRWFVSIGYAKEIANRAIYDMRLKRCYFSGWKNDKFAWQNLIGERTAGWTQGATKDAASKLDKIFKTTYDELKLEDGYSDDLFANSIKEYNNNLKSAISRNTNSCSDFVYGNIVECSVCVNGETCKKNEKDIHCNIHNKSFSSDHICVSFKHNESITEIADNVESINASILLEDDPTK